MATAMATAFTGSSLGRHQRTTYATLCYLISADWEQVEDIVSRIVSHVLG